MDEENPLVRIAVALEAIREHLNKIVNPSMTAALSDSFGGFTSKD